MKDAAKEVKELKDILVMKEYPEVLQDDLSGIPQVGEIDFFIDLISRSKSVARALCRAAINELQELKKKSIARIIGQMFHLTK